MGIFSLHHWLAPLAPHATTACSNSSIPSAASTPTLTHRRRVLVPAMHNCHVIDNCHVLGALQAQQVETLKQQLEVRYDPANPQHADMLRQLWGLAFPGQDPPATLKSATWKDMGWQVGGWRLGGWGEGPRGDVILHVNWTAVAAMFVPAGAFRVLHTPHLHSQAFVHMPWPACCPIAILLLCCNGCRGRTPAQTSVAQVWQAWVTCCTWAPPTPPCGTPCATRPRARALSGSTLLL
jgi:hypothetical protein